MPKLSVSVILRSKQNFLCLDGDIWLKLPRAFNFGEFKDGKAQQPLPPAFIPHESDLDAFSDYCHNMCVKILRLFALGLQVSTVLGQNAPIDFIPVPQILSYKHTTKPLQVDPKDGGENWLSDRHDPKSPSGCTLRLLYYPAVPETADYQPEVDIRAGAHSDYGSITLLFQRPGQPGLEILTAEEEWAPVPVYPPSTEEDLSPPILVNIGDLFSHWTNGLLKSTVHRVIFPKEARRGGEDR